jgi:hypothetical protein
MWFGWPATPTKISCLVAPVLASGRSGDNVIDPLRITDNVTVGDYTVSRTKKGRLSLKISNSSRAPY